MNEKKFHKLIEDDLSSEELMKKEKTLEIIYAKTSYYSKKQQKSKNYLRIIPIATAIALICIMIPISIILINNNTYHSIDANISNDSTNQSDSKTGEILISSGTTNNNEQEVIEVPQDCCEGIISIQGDKKYFDSINCLYHKEVLNNIKIEDYITGLEIDFEDIRPDSVIFALIITDENKQSYPGYQVGDMIKLIVK